MKAPYTKHPMALNRLTWKAILWAAITGLLAVGIPACVADRQATAIQPNTPSATLPPPSVVLVSEQPVEQPTITPTTQATDRPTVTPSYTPWPTATTTTQPTNTLEPTEQITRSPTEPSEIIIQITEEPTKPPPLPTPAGIYSWTLKVPILMYHYISEPPEDADKYRRDLSVTPSDFEAQMAYLANNNFETIDLYDLSLAITNKRELPEKPVIISLDDGYLDNFENAFPILQQYGHKATFFVVTQFIDEGREGYMEWDMIEAMAAAGMRIEPHSKTHPDLSGQERDYVIFEALGSQETIAAHIGYTPKYFCYPGGRFDEETVAILNELGYWGAVTTADGQWHSFDDRFEWSRIRMRNTTVLPEFATLVDPAGTVAGKPAE